MATETTDSPELMKKSDVAKMLQMTGRSVENLVKAGRLPAPIRLSKHPRWRRAELLRHLDSLGK